MSARGASSAGVFVATVAAGVVTSIITLLVVELVRKVREPALGREIVPGHGVA